MSDDKPVEPTVKTCAPTADMIVGKTGQSDSAGALDSVLLAKTGNEIIAGAKSRYQAATAAGYSHWTARNPTANGITVPRALQAAAEAFPAVGSSLRSHGRKADRVIDRTLTLQGNESPDGLQVQTAIAVKKLEQDADLPEETGNASRHLWRQRRLLRRLYALVLRSVEINGIDVARANLVAIEERDRSRFPLPVLLVAVPEFRSASQRQRSREAKPEREE